MNLARRCRPSLAATTLLTALMLGACSYSPERSLTVSDTAKPTSEKQAAAQAGAPTQKVRSQQAAAQSRTKRGNEGGTVKVADARRTVLADAAPQETSPRRSSSAASAQLPRRRVVASNSERECLVRAMYFESHRSSREGLLAVGTVVMNRVNSPSYPNSICNVVGQKRQFAPGVLSRPMSPRERHHADAVADELLAGARHAGIGDAMFFHVATRRYKYPNMRYLHVAGGNIFYRKVGRNAPRVTEGIVLAYADNAQMSETPSTAASAVTDQRVADKPVADTANAATATVAATQPPAAPVAAADRTAASPVAAPLPPPRTALALPPRQATEAQGEIATALPASHPPADLAATARASASQASAGITYTLPLPGALSPPRTVSSEPSTLLSYRTTSTPRAD